MDKVVESLRKTLTMCKQGEAAARYQVEYLQAVREHARFSGLRAFLSIDSKRNWDDNNSLMVVLPLLFPPHLFRGHSVQDMPHLVARACCRRSSPSSS